MVTDARSLPQTDLPKRAVNFYEYVDHNVHNGFLYFYSVTASDHAHVPLNLGNTLTDHRSRTGRRSRVRVLVHVPRR